LEPPGIIIHELGHLVLGLPDLYDVDDFANAGPVGHWDLMASGNYNTPAFPANLGAWSRAALGWVGIDSISTPAAGRPLTRRATPINRDRLAHLVPYTSTVGAPFLLLEHRTRRAPDVGLAGEGLLVWYIDPTLLLQRMTANRVNTPKGNAAVRLLQADGRQDLEAGQNRADATDPWPLGATSMRLDTASAPALPRTAATPQFRLSDITREGAETIRFTVENRTPPTGTQPATILPTNLGPWTAGSAVREVFAISESTGGATPSWTFSGGAMATLGLTGTSAGVLTGRPALRARDTIVTVVATVSVPATGTTPARAATSSTRAAEKPFSTNKSKAASSSSPGRASLRRSRLGVASA
jgi:hypothetical protein